MSGECGTPERGHKWIHNFGQKSQIKRSVGRHTLKGGEGRGYLFFLDLNETWCGVAKWVCLAQDVLQ